ncbi:hypothetical protein [Clostridium sp. B9]|uniref:hypothetical protein n=1 Tax=Clostridium sp. B9 TaxID=3423224 RepID=UPI003D2F14BA
MVEKRRSKLKKKKAKDIRLFVYGIWALIFLLDMIFNMNNFVMGAAINCVLIGILVYLEFYSRD